MSGETITKPEDAAPGFYGKVPVLGDFVSRRLPRSFIDPWDQWLQRGLSESRARLGSEWLNLYLQGPIWRFVLSPGVCGDGLWAGVLMPSVDKVGRYFPMTLAACLPSGVHPLHLLFEGEGWFVQLEALALASLEDDFELMGFDAALDACIPPATLSAGSPGPASFPALGAWRFPLEGDRATATALPSLTMPLLQTLLVGHSAWLTTGAAQIEPSLLLCMGLPADTGFAALIDGRWQQWGWEEV